MAAGFDAILYVANTAATSFGSVYLYKVYQDWKEEKKDIKTKIDSLEKQQVEQAGFNNDIKHHAERISEIADNLKELRNFIIEKFTR